MNIFYVAKHSSLTVRRDVSFDNTRRKMPQHETVDGIRNQNVESGIVGGIRNRRRYPKSSVVSEILAGIRNPGWNPKSWVVSEILGGIRNPGWYPKSWVVSEILGGIRNRRVKSEVGEVSPKFRNQKEWDLQSVRVASDI